MSARTLLLRRTMYGSFRQLHGVRRSGGFFYPSLRTTKQDSTIPAWQTRFLSNKQQQEDEDAKPPVIDKNVKPLLVTACTGIGQVVFLNSPVSGGIILVSLALADPVLAAMAGLGSLFSTFNAATLFKTNDTTTTLLSNGLYSYNGCLVGCAMYQLVITPADTSIMVSLPLTIVGATAATYLSTVPMTTPMPQWTIAFNIVTYTTLLALYETPAPPHNEVAVSTFDWIVSPLTGLGQIFLAESPVAGLGIACAMALYSPRIAVHAILGSAIGGITGSLLLGATSTTAGLWGYNAALTSVGTAVFLKQHTSVWVVSAVGASITAVVFGAMSSVSPVPILTIPFCTVMSGIWWLAKGKRVEGVELADVPHSPEKNV